MDIFSALLISATVVGAQVSAGALEFEQSYRHYHAAAEAYKRCDETDALRFATSHDPGELKSLVAEIPDPNEIASRGGRVPWASQTLAAAMLLHERAALIVPEAREPHEELAAAFLDHLIASAARGELRTLAHSISTVRLQFDGDVGGLVHALAAASGSSDTALLPARRRLVA